MHIIGIEGTALAGKSTLIQELAKILPGPCVPIPCFMEFVSAGTIIPAVGPKSKMEELDAIRFFANLELKRALVLQKHASSDTTVLMDRTVETLMAHAFAIDIGSSSFLDECWQLICECTSECPKPDRTIHLAASPASIKARARCRPGLPEILLEPMFVERFNWYFQAERRAEWPYTKIEADSSPGEVVSACYSAII